MAKRSENKKEALIRRHLGKTRRLELAIKRGEVKSVTKRFKAIRQNLRRLGKEMYGASAFDKGSPSQAQAQVVSPYLQRGELPPHLSIPTIHTIIREYQHGSQLYANTVVRVRNAEEAEWRRKFEDMGADRLSALSLKPLEKRMLGYRDEGDWENANDFAQKITGLALREMERLGREHNLPPRSGDVSTLTEDQQTAFRRRDSLQTFVDTYSPGMPGHEKLWEDTNAQSWRRGESPEYGI